MMNINPKTVTTVKKVIRKVPAKAVEAGTALVIGKALKAQPTPIRVVGALAVIVVAHYVIEWASQD